MINWYAQRSFYGDPDLVQQINNGIQRLDTRIRTAVGTQIYDHVEGSIKELGRLRTMLEEEKHGQHMTNTMIEDYVTEFLRLEDDLTRQKRFSRRSEEKLKGKGKALSGLHKTPLPVIHDSLDVLHWRLQVEELTKALEDEEDSPVQ